MEKKTTYDIPSFTVQTETIEQQKFLAWGGFQLKAENEVQLHQALAALHSLTIEDLLQLGRR